MTANTTSRPYEASDFLRIRDFLSESYLTWGRPFNWLIERWNYARYYIAPLIATWGMDDNDATVEQVALDAIARWESWVRVWEDNGEIVAVALSEDPVPGMGFTFQTPGYEHLLPELVDHIEATLTKDDGSVGVFCNGVDWPLTEILKERGYQINMDWADVISMYDTSTMPEVSLDDGYQVLSMADEFDLPKQREVTSRGFNHPDPKDWATLRSYREWYKAPDYNPELDLFVKAPEGHYVSRATLWYDPRIQVATLEPMATHPDYRRRGMGRAVLYEGIRRVAAMGATRVYVGSHQVFYLGVGFRKMHVGHVWERKA